MILVTKWFGTFLCESDRVIDKWLAPKDIDSIATRLRRIRGREILDEERELGARASAVAERRLGSIAEVTAFDAGFIRAEDFGFDQDLLREASMKLARESLVEEDPGAYITEQVRGFDDLVSICNLMSERLREWYGLYYPELEKAVDDRKYAELVSNDPDRASVAEAARLDANSSIGAPFSVEDLRAVRGFALATSGVFKSRESVESSIQHKMRDEAPNLTAVAGPIIGARLISLAGDLKRLASMPSSTIQLLGAEKAMFRHLKDRSRPPKHGVIFQHPHIHKAPYWQRGKIARALAGKISLAARADYYGEEDISKELLSALDKRLDEIRKRHPNPPRKTARNSKSRQKKGPKRR